ncbi:MAG: hypothetical protein IJQ49_00475 [Prevotella sp.]|nr:hypothetical protein [Prevotella sp.]
MKKILTTLAAALCCAMTTTVFTACGSDDDDNGNTPKIVGYQVDYSVSFPETVYSLSANADCGNLYLLFDKMEIGYIDENGQEQREVVNNKQWSKTVIYKKNVTCPLTLYLTKPASIDVESLPYEKYDLGVTATPTSLLDGITVLYSDGTKSKPKMDHIDISSSDYSYAVPKSKLVDYLSIFRTEVNIMTIQLAL